VSVIDDLESAASQQAEMKAESSEISATTIHDCTTNTFARKNKRTKLILSTYEGHVLRLT